MLVIVVALVEDRSIYLANLGDCRALLIDGGAPIQLTTDHRPSVCAEEKERILASGGFVGKHGVMDILGECTNLKLESFTPSPSSFLTQTCQLCVCVCVCVFLCEFL